MAIGPSRRCVMIFATVVVGLAATALACWFIVGVEWSKPAGRSRVEYSQVSTTTNLYWPQVERLTVWSAAARRAKSLLRAKQNAKIKAQTRVRGARQEVVKRLPPDRSMWSDWKKCAGPGQLCTCSGQLRVDTGQLSKAWMNSCWNPSSAAAAAACGIRLVQGHIPCNTSLPGFHQRDSLCYCSSAKARLNGRWQHCADESEPLFFSGMARFGHGTKWTAAQHLHGSGICNEGQFHRDPFPGQSKECQCQFISSK